MKIYAYLLSGIPITEYSSCPLHSLSGNAPYVLSNNDLTASGYINITSITKWDILGESLGRDYRYVQQAIASLVQTSGWSAFSLKEKEIIAKYFVVSKSLRDQVFTTKEQVDLGISFHLRSIEARRTRFERGLIEVYSRLTKNDAQDIVKEIEADHLSSRYILAGLEGTLEDGVEGLFDYLQARSGTSYKNSGLAKRLLIPIGMVDMQELSDKIMDILRDGNYTKPNDFATNPIVILPI